MKPIIFLAFSQDQHNNGQGYLPNLKQERINIGAALREVEAEGLVDLVIEPDATIEDIFNIFGDDRYRNRISIFHYAGHANGKGLYTEGKDGKNRLAHASGLRQLFSLQKNLQLVFLNGCSTEAQVQGLKDAKVKNIIATNRAIRDDIALMLSARFYQSIGKKYNIKDAFQISEAFIKTQKGGDNYRDFFYEDIENEPTTFPWELHMDEDNGEWKITSVGIVYGEQPNFKVFLAYAREDEDLKDELLKFTKPLKRSKQIDAFDAGMIGTGQDMNKILDKHFQESKIILLLITPNFINSDDMYDRMTAAMQRHEDGEAIVIPIYVREALIEDEAFTKLKPLPRNEQFVSQWENQDAAYTDIAKGIRSVVEGMKAGIR